MRINLKNSTYKIDSKDLSPYGKLKVLHLVAQIEGILEHEKARSGQRTGSKGKCTPIRLTDFQRKIKGCE